MSDQDLVDCLRKTLAAKGIPAAYLDRLTEELELHLLASVDRHLLRGLTPEQAQAAATAELGTEQEIVRTTLDALRRESFIGRHRALCMIVAPPLLMTMIRFLVSFLLMQLLQIRTTYQGMTWVGNRFSWIDGKIQIPLNETVYNLLIPLAFIQGLWSLGRRKFCGRIYTVAGCALLIYCAYSMQMSHYPGGTPPPPPSATPSVYQTILLSFYGLLLTAWLVRRNKDSEKQQVVQ